MPEPAPRVVATPAALELGVRLAGRHGPLMFHPSDGGCDGSAPMGYPLGGFRVGEIGGGMFAPEGPEGLRFLTRSRLCDDAEPTTLALLG